MEAERLAMRLQELLLLAAVLTTQKQLEDLDLLFLM